MNAGIPPDGGYPGETEAPPQAAEPIRTSDQRPHPPRRRGCGPRRDDLGSVFRFFHPCHVMAGRRDRKRSASDLSRRINLPMSLTNGCRHFPILFLQTLAHCTAKRAGPRTAERVAQSVAPTAVGHVRGDHPRPCHDLEQTPLEAGRVRRRQADKQPGPTGAATGADHGGGARETFRGCQAAHSFLSAGISGGIP